MSEGNCHGFDIMFSIDFDLNKTDNISVLLKENEIRNETFRCKVMAHRDGVCSLSLLSSNKKAMALLFYLKHKVRFSINNKSFSYHTATPESSINDNRTTPYGNSPSLYDNGHSTNDSKPSIKMNSLEIYTSRLLKTHRYKLRYEGKMIKFGNLIWKECGKVFKF